MPTSKAVRFLGSVRDEPRRLRDLVRSQIHHGDYPDGQLPNETELMVKFGVSRSVVREALGMLRQEGVIDRLQGVGTLVQSVPTQARLMEVHGVATGDTSVFSAGHPEVLTMDVVPTPSAVVARLGTSATPTCARIEYVHVMGEQVALATNYVVFPEAEALLTTPFKHDWYTSFVPPVAGAHHRQPVNQVDA